MTHPLDLVYADADRLIAAASPHNDDVQAALAYADGDVWQDGRGWAGPQLTPGTPGADLLLQEIKRTLAGANLIRDLVGRHASGVLGHEPAWDMPGLPQQDVEAMTAWWYRAVVPTPPDYRTPLLPGVLGVALMRALCGDIPVLRLRIRPATQGAPRTLDDALSRIAVEVLSGDTAAVYDDLESGPAAFARLRANARTIEALLNLSSLEYLVEISAVMGQSTYIAVRGQHINDESDPLPLGGRITMAAMRVPPLVTPALLGIQRQLVKTLTVMGRNTDTAGFVERVMLNAQRPGTEIADETAPGGRRFVPAPYEAGPGVANWLVGIQQADGSITQPSVTFRDPVDPGTFLDTARGLIYHAHKEARQLHALIAGDAAPSGESRRQAAADFLSGLGPTAQAVESITRWLLETAYALALSLRNQAAPDGLAATARCHLSGTLPTVEELGEIREAVGAGLLSRATYQEASGIGDPDAEDARIDMPQEPQP